MTHQHKKQNLSPLDRVDLALASRLVGTGIEQDLIAAAQRALDGIRLPAPADAEFLISLLRLRGLAINDDEAEKVIAGRHSKIPALSQEYRLLCGLKECLNMVRERAATENPPDGWFMVELFRTMVRGLPRFRDNDLRRCPPWDAMLYINYAAPERLRISFHSVDS